MKWTLDGLTEKEIEMLAELVSLKLDEYVNYTTALLEGADGSREVSTRTVDSTVDIGRWAIILSKFSIL